MADKNKPQSETPKTEAESHKIGDVTAPGKTPALATSRPLIVKHGPMAAQDPMVVNESSEKPTVAAPAKESSGELTIKPDASATEDTETTKEESVESATDEKEEQAVPDENSKESTAESSVDSSEAGSGAVDALANEVDAKQAEKKERKELEERNLELEKSITSKEFFVPIGVASRRRSNQRIFWLLIFIIIVGLAGLNFAVDAEVLDIGVPAFTDLL
jgi:hypothetical protein